MLARRFFLGTATLGQRSCVTAKIGIETRFSQASLVSRLINYARGLCAVGFGAIRRRYAAPREPVRP